MLQDYCNKIRYYLQKYWTIFMQNNEFLKIIETYIDKIIKKEYDKSKQNLKDTKILYKITRIFFPIITSFLYLLDKIKII